MYCQDTTFPLTKFLEAYYNIYGVKLQAYLFSV